MPSIPQQTFYPNEYAGDREQFMRFYCLFVAALDFAYFLLPFARRLVMGSAVRPRYVQSTLTKWAIILHVITGTYLIMFGSVAVVLIFADRNDIYEELAAYANPAFIAAGFGHGLSAILLLKKVQGERRITVPTYIAVIMINLYNSVRMAQEPTSFELLLFLWLSTNAFIFVRVVGLFLFLSTSIEWHTIYTIAVATAATMTVMTAPKTWIMFCLVLFVATGPVMEHILDARLGLRTVFLKSQMCDKEASSERQHVNSRTARNSLSIAMNGTPTLSSGSSADHDVSLAEVTDLDLSETGKCAESELVAA